MSMPAGPPPDQAAFRAALLDAALPSPPGLQDASGRPAQKRFDVYRNNVAVSLSDALETAFPALKALVGDSFFRAMAGVFLRAHPPSSPVMMFYGAEMPDFLRGFPPAAGFAYLPDIARLELALRHAYHAADATPLAPEALQVLEPDVLAAARFSLVPAATLVSSPYPVHDIYRTATRRDAPKPRAEAQSVLVTRPDLDPQLDPLSPSAAKLVAALNAGTPLGMAAEAAGPDLDLGASLHLLLARQALHTVTTN